MMVVLVNFVVAGFLGYLVYDASHEVSEMMGLSIATNASLGPEEAQQMIAAAAAYDTQILYGVVIGISVLVICIFVTGIVVTHRVVGPAYRIQRCLEQVGRGELRISTRIRRNDELQNVFVAFERMIESLRGAQEEEIARLSKAIDGAKQAGLADEDCAELIAVRDDMIAALDA